MRIPEEMASARYGVTAYHDTQLVGELQGMTPEEHLRELIIQTLGGDIWEGRASALYRALTADGSMAFEARSLVQSFNSLGRYLGAAGQDSLQLFSTGREQQPADLGNRPGDAKTFVKNVERVTLVTLGDTCGFAKCHSYFLSV
jgi:hypothetical protein